MIGFSAKGIAFVLLASVPFGLVAGCGGSAPPPQATTPITTGRAVISIQWPPRGSSRLIPIDANSLRVTFLSGTQIAQTTVIARSSSSTTQSYVDLPAGDLTAQAQAFPSNDASGVAQAGVQVPVTIRAGEKTAVSLTLASAISRVAITPDSIPFSSDPVQIGAIAYDSQNRVVVTGSWQWSVPNDGIIQLTPNGAMATIQALREGTTTITLRETESGVTFQKQIVASPQGVGI